MGVGETFRPTPVGVFFGGPGETPSSAVPDPYFGGEGPDRNPCRNCGECMTGCRHNAKNTLVKNYLHLAEKNGATVLPLTTVTRVSPRDEGGYDVHVRHTKAKLRRRTASRVLTADQVVFAASALGTQRLLHQMKAEGHLPRLSDRLGEPRPHQLRVDPRRRSRGTTSVDYTQGVAITSSFHPDEHTHIEPVRYGKGSNSMSLLQTVLTDGDGDVPRWRTWLREMWSERKRVRELYDVRHWSERTVIALVMQSSDNSITTFVKRNRLGRWVLTSKQGHGDPNPTWIPAGNEAARRMAEVMGGTAGGTIGEPFNRPMTAHFIGGCTIGASAASGVIDAYQRVYGHPGLHIADGSAITANLGVNPSLSITAQAERAMAFWPNRGQADPRPPLGSAYERVGPVAPASPAVPPSAPGALRLPLVEIT